MLEQQASSAAADNNRHGRKYGARTARLGPSGELPNRDTSLLAEQFGRVPAPVEMPVRPAPTCTRATRGPMLVRTPRLDARTLTPGAILTEKLMPASMPSLIA